MNWKHRSRRGIFPYFLWCVLSMCRRVSTPGVFMKKSHSPGASAKVRALLDFLHSSTRWTFFSEFQLKAVAALVGVFFDFITICHICDPFALCGRDFRTLSVWKRTPNVLELPEKDESFQSRTHFSHRCKVVKLKWGYKRTCSTRKFYTWLLWKLPKFTSCLHLLTLYLKTENLSQSRAFTFAKLESFTLCTLYPWIICRLLQLLLIFFPSCCCVPSVACAAGWGDCKGCWGKRGVVWITLMLWLRLWARLCFVCVGV